MSASAAFARTPRTAGASDGTSLLAYPFHVGAEDAAAVAAGAAAAPFASFPRFTASTAGAAAGKRFSSGVEATGSPCSLTIIVLDAGRVVEKGTYDELVAKGDTKASFESTLDDVRKRDAQDMGRAIAPLKQADDAVLVDSSEMGIEATVEKMAEHVRQRMR